jgi:hypothetical protein
LKQDLFAVGGTHATAAIWDPRHRQCVIQVPTNTLPDFNFYLLYNLQISAGNYNNRCCSPTLNGTLLVNGGATFTLNHNTAPQQDLQVPCLNWGQSGSIYYQVQASLTLGGNIYVSYLASGSNAAIISPCCIRWNTDF